MKFNDLYKLITESVGENYFLFILEDNEGKSKLMQMFMKQLGLDPMKSVVIDNAPQAADYIRQNSNLITHYTLDYDLRGYDGTGADVANVISNNANSGENVWIHSDNPEGREQILKILPQAKVAPAPNNIIQIKKSIQIPTL